ncbi:hypothetical protein [Streptomyces sp. NBC_00564]|uniref:hypothetical protein n=1 Tax=Streptomyces sp. NBC_00564 TaxID=2903663 RepID=UPI00352BF228|nr:hypothetical protein OG256_45165 [Streptomyces sp. NBC_00564]
MPSDVRGALAGDHRQDPAAPQFAAYGLGAVGLVAQQGVWAAARMLHPSGDGRDAVDQGEGLGDVDRPQADRPYSP